MRWSLWSENNLSLWPVFKHNLPTDTNESYDCIVIFCTPTINSSHDDMEIFIIQYCYSQVYRSQFLLY